ncbi:MAG: 23S rRNA (adenine(2503)-C(2))-methyltransferase RlmN [Eubacteriaceae bacterium]
MKENIFGKDISALEKLMQEIGEPKFRGKQLFQWIYKKKKSDFDTMSDFSKALREKLKEVAIVTHGEIVETQIDNKDDTRKYLIKFEDDQTVESVLMHYDYGKSLCVSTQVGCRMGCKFCASTVDGKVRDLSVGEILDQIYLVETQEKIKITHIVLMGMGEPLDNYDNVLKFIEIANTGFEIGQRRITLSTCGLIPEINRLAQEGFQINLAISLHAALQKKREILMPIAKKYSLENLTHALESYFQKTGRQITFEYALIDKFNDQEEDQRALEKLLKGTQHHLNLIRLNAVGESPYRESKEIENFFKGLKNKGLNVTLRRKMGREIDAACGQLRKKRKKDKVIV